MKAMRKNLRKNIKKKKAASKKISKKTAKTSAKVALKLTSKAPKIKSQAPVVTQKKHPLVSSAKSSNFHKVREIVVWVLAGIMVLGGFLTLAFGTKEKSPDASSSFQNKLHEVAVLNSEENKNAVTLVATGDILLARYVELKMRNLGDYTYPFQKIGNFLSNADIAFGNLETPFFPGRNVQTDVMTFRGDLAGVKGLQYAGFDVLSIANNHTMNYQVPGLTTTLQELKKANILASGGGKNVETAHSPVIVDVRGKKIAFLSYIDPNIPPKIHGITMGNYPGLARMDTDDVKNDIKNTIGKADAIVVSMHAGIEYSKKPTKFQQEFARAAIDAGASVVIGHHPHVVQPVEYYGNGVIFYSLGNFVFDQFFSPDVQTGLVAKFTFTDGAKPAVELLPVKIEGVQPRILEGEEGNVALKRMGVM